MSRWLFFPTQASANDWDTYSIAVSAELSFSGGTWVGVGTLTPSGTNFAPSQFREGFFGLQVRLGNTSNSYSTDVPYLAIWNETDSRWTVHAYKSGNGNADQTYNKTTYEPAASGLPSSGDTLRVVGLSQYTSGDVASWNNYA